MPPRARALNSKERLPTDQRQRLREVFDAIDKDGDEELDYPELKAALKKFGVDLSLKELKQMWIAADKDASSSIDFDEFCDAIEAMPKTLNRQESMTALQATLRGSDAEQTEQEGPRCEIM
jgi:Ca2+-binding EF-hand superfamily protein